MGARYDALVFARGEGPAALMRLRRRAFAGLARKGAAVPEGIGPKGGCVCALRSLSVWWQVDGVDVRLRMTC